MAGDPNVFSAALCPGGGDCRGSYGGTGAGAGDRCAAGRNCRLPACRWSSLPLLHARHGEAEGGQMTDTPKIAAARIEVERTKAALLDTARDLQQRLQPKTLANEAWEKAKNK